MDEYVRLYCAGGLSCGGATDLALLPSLRQYEGTNTSIYDASVQLIIENVVTSLLADSSRRFGARPAAGPDGPCQAFPGPGQAGTGRAGPCQGRGSR